MVFEFRLLGLYIIQGGADDKKVLYSWAAGCNSEDLELAIYEAEATQMQNTRSKDKTYHLVVSFRPEDEEKLTEEILKEIELEFAKALGFKITSGFAVCIPIPATCTCILPTTRATLKNLPA